MCRYSNAVPLIPYLLYVNSITHKSTRSTLISICWVPVSVLVLRYGHTTRSRSVRLQNLLLQLNFASDSDLFPYRIFMCYCVIHFPTTFTSNSINNRAPSLARIIRFNWSHCRWGVGINRPNAPSRPLHSLCNWRANCDTTGWNEIQRHYFILKNLGDDI